MTALRMTPATMQTIIRYCRAHLPREACGFIVATKDDTTGVRIVPMENVSPNPVREFMMRDDAVKIAYNEFDQLGDEPIAVFHSHPTSEPIMSDKDLAAAADESLAYMVLSLGQRKPSARAYRVKRFVGNVIPTAVPIEIGELTKPRTVYFTGPWALTPGNRVRITYKRDGKTSTASSVATVLECDETAVRVDPDRAGSARMINMERILEVHVIKESIRAKVTRAELRANAGAVRTLLAGTDVGSVPEALAGLARAFPASIAISMEEEEL